MTRGQGTTRGREETENKDEAEWRWREEVQNEGLAQRWRV